jgi:P-type Cu2+ transporter
MGSGQAHNHREQSPTLRAHGSHHAAPVPERSHHADHTGHEAMFRRRFWVSLALSIPVIISSEMVQMWVGFTLPAFPGSSWVGPSFAVAVFIYGGTPFLRMAWPELLNRRPGMMTLVSLAITVAFAYSLAALVLPEGEDFFWELVTLIDIMLLGHWLEMRSVREASGALTELARLLPDTAERVLAGGALQEVEADRLAVGDLILVRPGSSIAADGLVETGESEVDESMLTGETRPVVKTPGASVTAGAINGDGSLRVRVTAAGTGTALAGIMRLVAEAQQSRSATQVLADRAAGWLFYVAVAVAAVTAVVWTLATGFNAEVVSRVATVLVIACPHALGLAVPLVVALVTSLGAKRGILIRDRVALEEARRVTTVVFDKTGTLTEGRFEVAGMAVAGGIGEREALALAAGLEADSEHPVAAGIRAAGEARRVRAAEITGFQSVKGRGVQGFNAGSRVALGGPGLLEHLGIDSGGAFAALEEEALRTGRTLIYLVRGDAVTAAFALGDAVRPESRAAVDELHAMGMDVALLTGDAEQVARAVSEELGIDRYYAGVLPERKQETVADLQAAGRRVAMVGDGVNDAPALAAADIGVAIGSGTDVAIESAGIVLMHSDPRDVAAAVRLSRAGYRKMVENLVWATGYNIVALPLAAGILAPFGILLSPAVGAILMSVSTIVVAVNAQLLRRDVL